MNSKFFDYLFPVIGGAGGSVLGFITLNQVVSAIILSFIGAIIGCFVNYLWNKFFKKKKL